MDSGQSDLAAKHPTPPTIDTPAAEVALATGDSLFVDGNLDDAIESYTTSICLTDERRCEQHEEHTLELNAATKIVRFRSLAHRSSAYLLQKKHVQALSDAKSALSLYVPRDVESKRLRMGELASCHDRVARAALGVAAKEAVEIARSEWESALALAGVIEGSKGEELVRKYSACLKGLAENGCVKEVPVEEKKTVKEPANELLPAEPSSIVATGVSSREQAAKATTAATTTPKYQYYQDDNYMKIQILEANVEPSNLSVQITPDELSVKLTKNNVTYSLIYGDLYEEVIVNKCRTIIKDEKVLIKLKKKTEKVEWHKLLDDSKSGERKKGRVEKRKEDGEDAVTDGTSEGGDSTAEGKTDASVETSTKTETAINKTAAQKPAMPRPYASDKDWDKIDRDLALEEEKETPEGDEALNKLFKQIYSNADENTRRAMVKSMQTSGGTVLSTNWDEVGKTDYEKERQAPKGMEWKNYEGEKLPMKEDD